MSESRRASVTFTAMPPSIHHLQQPSHNHQTHSTNQSNSNNNQLDDNNLILDNNCDNINNNDVVNSEQTTTNKDDVFAPANNNKSNNNDENGDGDIEDDEELSAATITVPVTTNDNKTNNFNNNNNSNNSNKNKIIINNIDDDDIDSTEDFQISLAPYIQTYLTQTGRRHSCCSVMLPVAFERAAPKSWLDPRFDSAVLEGQYQASIFPQIRLRFRFALCYILICSLVWMLYFLLNDKHDINLLNLIIFYLFLFSIIIVCFILTYTNIYRLYKNIISCFIATFITILSIIFLLLSNNLFSQLGHFAICVEIILLIYTMIPLPLWLSSFITIIYSILFELLCYFLNNNYDQEEKIIKTGTIALQNNFVYKILAVRILLQLCIHLVGVHVLIMNVVRMRGTFMKVGQNLLVRRQLEMEKQLKEKMIHSVMPPKVADMLLKEAGPPSVDMTAMGNGGYPNNRQRRLNDFRPRTSNDVKSLFRPFHMHSMDNVSILFADIVGFTKMSSTKTAEQLVEILNDLFERFDDLCVLNGCEKISTLGDCYYCVSGCPEPRPDHGICCVEMGLGMIAAMRAFDAQRHEGVKMRVGVHTGTVLCGIVGTRRVKFDVWSNDVTLANRMESSGRPEQVHISGETCSFLGDGYILEEGEEVFGHRTYFVLGRKRDLLGSANVSQSDLSCLLPPIDQGLTLLVPRLNNASGDGFTNSVQLSQSATNLSAVHPSVPPASPVGLSNSLNPSPVMQHRPRISSLNKVTKFLTTGGGNHVAVVPAHNGNGEAKRISKYQQPKIIVTAKSLPGSLDSDADENLCCKHDVESHLQNKDESLGHENKNLANKPISKFRYWKVPKFMRKLDSGINSGVADTKKVTTEEDDRKVTPIISEETVPCLDQNGGYQQLPVVIETPRPSHCTLEIPSRLMIASPISVRAASSAQHPDSNSPAASHSMFDDIIDVRSYISQSRSDISPFARSGSYRSQCGRSPQGEISPTGRPRSSTIAASRFCEIPMPWADGASICASAASRKDSGIRSNSRRSSIQQQIYAINQNVVTNQQRVSGYFTSSQSSLTGIPPEPVAAPPPQHPDPLAACLQQLRKQSDLQLIRCVRDNARSQRSYLVKPPVSDITLFFKSRQMENDFRSKAHRFGSENEMEGPPTLATPRYNTYIDILTGVIVYLSISAALFLLLPTQFAAPYRAWVCLFVVFTSVQLFALFLSTKQMCRTKRQRRKSTATTTTQLTSISSCSDNIFEIVSGWYLWHLCGALLMSLPVIAVLINFLLIDINNIKSYEYHYGLLLFICIIHFCNFTQLNFWMRNFLSLLAGICFLLIAVMHFHHIQITIDSFKTVTTMIMDENPVNNNTIVFDNKITTTDIYSFNTDIANKTSGVSSFDADYLVNLTDIKVYENHHQQQLDNELKSEHFLKNFHNFGKYQIEILIDLILLLILVWFLNREFEIGYRLTFYGNAVANQDKIRVQNMKNQADILLHNIIPKHVAEQLKNTAKYSENHKNVGIIFASIINFNEMYDESYLGGKEYLRVLNELIGDFDELLSRYEFRCVEKIKTIGSTFMAASGLDPSNRGDNGEHLFALIDFALAMQQVVDSFNKDLLEFNLILRIGYNVGDVTAGVIGTSKLYYDIWGDAVNVASRMDSTGLPGRIQVGGGSYLKLLEQRYNFESRGQVYVKGKDHMEVYLLIGPKSDDLNDDLIQESNSLIHNS